MRSQRPLMYSHVDVWLKYGMLSGYSGCVMLLLLLTQLFDGEQRF